MKAHLYVDGGGMVTGTSEVDKARELIRAEWLGSTGWASESELPEDERSGWDFWAHEPAVEVGRTVPAGRDSDYGWFWRRGGNVGDRGVTTAVVWNPGEILLRTRLSPAERQTSRELAARLQAALDGEEGNR